MLSVSNNESSSDLIILNANELLWTVGQKYTYRLICKYINTTKMTSWCQRRMGRLVRDNRKATVTQITTRYKICRIPSLNAQHVEAWSRWATAAEDHTGCRSCQLRTGNGGYNSHRFTKIGKTLPGLMSLDFCCDIQDGRVRIWRKEHESMDPSCLVSTVQAGGGVMVWGIFSWHTLGLLVPIELRLISTAYLSIVDHVHPFRTTVYTSSDATSSRIMHHATKLKSSQTGFLNMTMTLYSNGLHSHQISI